MKIQFSLLVLLCFLCSLGCNQKKKTLPKTETPTTFKISLPPASLESDGGSAQFSSQSPLEAPSDLPLEITGSIDDDEGSLPQAIMEICSGSVVVDSHYLNIGQDKSFKIQSVALPKGSYQLRINFVQHNSKASIELDVE